MSALSGIRVLDFTRVVSGPYCTQLLSDLGAEVVKIERPGSGDDSRAFGPPFVKGESAYFLSLNRGKKSVVIDLATDSGRDTARRLARKFDVVVENFRIGYMASVGLDYETLATDNDRLVYCSMTAFGETGPYKDRAGYDVMVSALGGMMGLTGMPGGPPVKTGVALLDVATGLHAATAICAALYERERSGKGQRIELSLLGVQLSTLINAASVYLVGGEVMGPQGNTHVSIVPYGAFRAADGHIVIGAANDSMFARLCAALEAPELANDRRFTTNADRVAHREELESIDWRAAGDGNGVRVGRKDWRRRGRRRASEYDPRGLLGPASRGLKPGPSVRAHDSRRDTARRLADSYEQNAREPSGRAANPRRAHRRGPGQAVAEAIRR